MNPPRRPVRNPQWLTSTEDGPRPRFDDRRRGGYGGSVGGYGRDDYRYRGYQRGYDRRYDDRRSDDRGGYRENHRRHEDRPYGRDYDQRGGYDRRIVAAAAVTTTTPASAIVDATTATATASEVALADMTATDMIARATVMVAVLGTPPPVALDTSLPPVPRHASRTEVRVTVDSGISVSLLTLAGSNLRSADRADGQNLVVFSALHGLALYSWPRFASGAVIFP